MVLLMGDGDGDLMGDGVGDVILEFRYKILQFFHSLLESIVVLFTAN